MSESKDLQRVHLHLRRHGGACEPGHRAGPADARKGPGDRIFVRGSGAGTGEGPDPQGGLSTSARSTSPASTGPSSLGEIRHNLVSVGNLMRAPGEARAILREFRPGCGHRNRRLRQLPHGEGGCQGGDPHGRPRVQHGARPHHGDAGALCADRIMVGFEACREHYRHPEKVIVTGTPVRRDFFHLTKAEAKRQPGRGRRPAPACVLLGVSGGLRHEPADGGLPGAGGGEGAFPPHPRRRKGPAIRCCWSCCGRRAWTWRTTRRCRCGSTSTTWPPVMRAADLVLCRAGASTISELTALGVPALIVPSPYVTNNHQEKNARVLENGRRCRGAAGEGLLRSDAVPGGLRHPS